MQSELEPQPSTHVYPRFKGVCVFFGRLGCRDLKGLGFEDLPLPTRRILLLLNIYLHQDIACRSEITIQGHMGENHVWVGRMHSGVQDLAFGPEVRRYLLEALLLSVHFT